MATAVVFHEAINNIGKGLILLNSDTFKAVLTNSAPSQADDDELADITQIANGNGYTTGGVALANVTWVETGSGTGIWQFSCDDFEWTASGSMGPFRYVAIYSDTSTGDKLVAYIDIGTAITLASGLKFTVDVGANGLFRIGQGTIS